ncbi:MAG: metallopeptidase TldD-related protein [Candidatus Cloacimonetes bacterium]|nr:metallopeptidase TldD-related protein [Candidatus Cloacimonadota bacterium]
MVSCDSIRSIIKEATSNASFLGRKKSNNIILPSSAGQSRNTFFTDKKHITDKEKIAFLKEIDQYILNKYPGLTSRVVSHFVLEMEKQLLTSDNGESYSMIPRAGIGCSMTLMKNGSPVSLGDAFGGFGQFEDLFSDPSLLYPEIDTIYERMTEFSDYVKQNYSTLILEQFVVKFIHNNGYFMNSNGIDLSLESGCYSVFPMFTSKEGKNTSSFNYCGATIDNLDKPFIELGRFAELMKESTEQIVTKPVPDNFIGDIIITPECLEDFLYNFEQMIGSYTLITDTCLYKDKINQKIATDSFTLHSKPLSDDFVNYAPYDSDGFLNSNTVYIDKGILKSFILGLYGSKKTGLPRSANLGNYWEVEAGDKSQAEIIKSVNKGILLCRFSGGSPAENGDFSGVAKNSYYIEDGKIQYPVSETMISGNIVQMLLDIQAISKERLNYGSSLLPWISVANINISGK